ncbi:MAG: tetratricopeptide repeat protein [Gemmatimonadaceae bacterium]|nr:tetratricopeptide repeat protein [Gemmatimonadaceae bacterium]
MAKTPDSRLGKAQPPDASEEELRSLLRARKAKRLRDARCEMLDTVDRLRFEGRKAELGEALRELGELERRLPDTDAPRRHYEESVAVLRDAGDTLKLAHSIRHLGDVHYDAGRVDLAEPCYHEALSIYRGNSDARPLDLANAIRSLAVLKADAGEIEDANRLWREAYHLYVEVNVLTGVTESAIRIALLARTQGDSEKAREWARRGSVAADASGDGERVRQIREIRASIDG